jgi:membrane-associated phospholipid phosphatase
LLVLFIAALILFKQFLILPKMLMVAMIIMVAFLLRKSKPLVRDWIIFIAFIYLFDSLRGTIYILACKLQLPAYALYVVNTEKALFRGVPSVTLQNLLLRPDPLGNVGWLERLLTLVYGSHFIGFLLVGLIIWIYKAKDFPLYRTSFYLLSGTGILFYFLVPTVPPWMAANHFGLMPPLNHFNVELFNLVIPDISNGFDTNPIAAMPSLHAGFPVLCSVLLWRLYRWKGTPFYLYTLAVLFAIVYSGDHYVTDVLAGLALAVACYLLARRILQRRPVAPADGIGPKAADPFGGAVLKRRLLLGLGVFLAAVVIGGINKTQFNIQANSYSIDVPRYVDFFRHEDVYKDSYPVQMYFGNHFLARHELRTALRYLERSLELARNPIERKDTQMKIGFCRQFLGEIN